MDETYTKAQLIDAWVRYVAYYREFRDEFCVDDDTRLLHYPEARDEAIATVELLTTRFMHE